MLTIKEEKFRQSEISKNDAMFLLPRNQINSIAGDQDLDCWSDLWQRIKILYRLAGKNTARKYSREN
ncbi:MAG: hypothetical protein HQL20_08605 [Candidatus Omnitrophica bacterium]|nr:hypothetical protein [Candidatus Omnitrophota bacterium]